MVVMIGTPKFAMHGLLIPGLPKLVAYCEQHGQIRQRLLPKLDRHLVSEQTKIIAVMSNMFSFSSHTPQSKQSTWTHRSTAHLGL